MLRFITQKKKLENAKKIGAWVLGKVKNGFTMGLLMGNFGSKKNWKLFPEKILILEKILLFFLFFSCNKKREPK